MWRTERFQRLLKWLLILCLTGVALLLSSSASAASVHFCKPNTMRCVITIQDGIVGDRVNILDEKAHVVAYGRIIKRNRSYAIIKLVRVMEEIRKGYPVVIMINSRRAAVEWASAFSDPMPTY